MSITGKQSLEKKRSSCGEPCEIWSRVCGYFRPVSAYSLGKQEEFKDRKTFNVNQASMTIQSMSAAAQALRKKKVAAIETGTWGKAS